MSKHLEPTTVTPPAGGRRAPVDAARPKQDVEAALRAERRELRAGTEMSGNATRRYVDSLRKQQG